MINIETVNATVSPKKHMDVLSQAEIYNLLDHSHGGNYDLFRKCALAVLSSGIELDDGKELLERYSSFDIKVLQTEHGIKLQLTNAPASAFVDGEIIRGISEHLFSVLRDVVFLRHVDLLEHSDVLANSESMTDMVFHTLRNANLLKRTKKYARMVVCWGGHSIPREEYDYTKLVGYQLGLRRLNICTGCGMGAMKGPMKGATIAHAKQRIKTGQYLGLTEPGIVAAEAPNPIVSDLVILPDIEKRLEAFVRIGHGIIVFPGGVGTIEEVLYILGVLLNPENAEIPFPLILTGPKSAADYFKRLDEYIAATLGDTAREKYQIIIDDPAKVAQTMNEEINKVDAFRRQVGDAFYFNWKLKIDEVLQMPFIPTHDSMRNLQLSLDLPKDELVVNMRKMYSGIVAGNIKEHGIQAILEHGVFELSGDAKLMEMTDELLRQIIKQGRMKLPGQEYHPCYRIVK